ASSIGRLVREKQCLCHVIHLLGPPMSDNDMLSDRLRTLSSGRAGAVRLRDGVLSLVLDVTGLGETERSALTERIEAEALKSPGVAQVRIAQSSEKQELVLIAVASGKGG